MATLAPNSASSSPPLHRRRKSWARKIERACCLTLSYFPLTFVYGLTTWAVFVEVQVSFVDTNSWFSYFKAALGILLYGLANASYTIAVFTPPGSPIDSKPGRGRRLKGAQYEGLPAHEDEEQGLDIQSTEDLTSVTAKSTGKQRFCKKCNTVKPDRTHHCSSCKQCVLKMDHHCPWLATCVGMRNYKAFLLFLTYTSLFALTCFAVSINWVWTNMMKEIAIEEGWRLVNTIMLSVLGGIIGLVLSCFTSWHLWLTYSGQTTIESLEKTRYLNPIRKSMEHHMHHGRNYLSQGNVEEQQSLTSQLTEIHANALPGVLRAEEGEVQRPIANGSPARQSLQRNFAAIQAQREQDRYEAYLDEQDSERLPNAFDLGWRRNLLHVFGPSPWLWALPVCNTTGDGWQWDVSSKWTAARDNVARARAQRRREDARWDAHNPATYPSQPVPAPNLRWQPGQGFVDAPRPPRMQSYNTQMQMQPLDRRKGQAGDDVDSYTTSSDEETHRGVATGDRAANWNDVPEDMLAPRNTTNGSGRSRSAGRTKGD